MAKKKKHVPPARQRYVKTHPTVSFRLCKADLKGIRKLAKMEGKTLSQIIKEDLIKHATSYAKAYREAHDKAKQTYREAYNRAMQIDHITVECRVCGKPLVIKSTDPEWAGVLDALRWKHFRHPECTPRTTGEMVMDKLNKMPPPGWD